MQVTREDVVARLQKREHYFRNAIEGEYDANLLMEARFEIERLSARVRPVVGRAKAAFEEYAQFLTDNQNAEPKEFLPALKQWADVTLGLMPELLDCAASADRSPEGQDGGTRLDAKHESAVPQGDAHE